MASTTTTTRPSIEDAEINNEYLSEIYQNLLMEEREQPSFFGYMKRQPEINEKMRAMLIDWLIDVHFKFKLKPETLYLTVWLIDRYLSEKTIKYTKLQLLGVTAMLISCKYEEIYSPEVFDFVYITENTYEKSDIIRLEKEILSMISFKMTVPTANAFYEIISESLAFDKKEYYLGRYLMEILLLDYRSLNLLLISHCYSLNTSHQKLHILFVLLYSFTKEITTSSTLVTSPMNSFTTTETTE